MFAASCIKPAWLRAAQRPRPSTLPTPTLCSSTSWSPLNLPAPKGAASPSHRLPQHGNLCPALLWAIFSPAPCYFACLAGVCNWSGQPHLLSAFLPCFPSFSFPLFLSLLRSVPLPHARCAHLAPAPRPPAAICSCNHQSLERCELPAWGLLRSWSGLPRNWIRWWPGRAR